MYHTPKTKKKKIELINMHICKDFDDSIQNNYKINSTYNSKNKKNKKPYIR